MKNKSIVYISLICLTAFFIIAASSYGLKNSSNENKLSYDTEVSEVKFNDENNTELLASTLQNNIVKEKEDQSLKKEINKSEINNTTSEKNNSDPQQQNNASGGNTIADNLKTVGSNNQIILVTTSGYGTSYARIRTFEKINDKFAEILNVSGYIGKYGFAQVMSEGGMSSPRGKFSVGTAFGRYGNPGTRLNFRNITGNDYWVDDPNSSLYNTWQTGPVNGRWNSAEKMNIAAYNYGFVINYNTSERIPGKGSAIFFHVSSGYTAGCTGTSQENVIKILNWLDPSKNPVIIQCPESELVNY